MIRLSLPDKPPWMEWISDYIATLKPKDADLNAYILHSPALLYGPIRLSTVAHPKTFSRASTHSWMGRSGRTDRACQPIVGSLPAGRLQFAVLYKGIKREAIFSTLASHPLDRNTHQVQARSLYEQPAPGNVDMATCSSVVASASQEGMQHKPRTYTPSPWGDFFMHHQPCAPSELLLMKEKAQVKEEEVRQIIIDTGASSELVLKLELVDTLQRIGVDYHYMKEIDELLRSIYDTKGEGCDELYITSLWFYLLRKHGYSVSSDVFVRFRNDQEDFKSDNVNSLLALYDAAHLRTHGEEILDNAITFTKSRLQSMMKNLDPELEEEVRYTLETPRYRRVERIEARRYISVYEKKAMRDEAILEFAKLDYNIVQALYCEELKALSIWWKDFQARTFLVFARDRMVELHFWMLGVVYEPQYSYSRIMLTKLMQIVSLFDDLCDNYSTSEENRIFTAALERWDEQAVEKLPTYLKALYINVLNTTDEVVEELKLQNNKHAELIRKLVIDTAKCYHAEVKWRDEHYIPHTVEEHLQISLCSSICMHIMSLAFISLGDVTTETIEWALTYPKIIKDVCIIARISNDIVSHEREQASEHVVSTVQTCIKQYMVTVEQANEKLRTIIEETWMDIIQECLDQKQPMEVLHKTVHLARTTDFLYKREDAYTLSFSLKGVLTSLYVNFV
ncbi:hypothetical protein ACP70R_021299 [Stipagrostis hirtigluma subsp. patula]